MGCLISAKKMSFIAGKETLSPNNSTISVTVMCGILSVFHSSLEQPGGLDNDETIPGLLQWTTCSILAAVILPGEYPSQNI